jgi:hypothetical protein
MNKMWLYISVITTVDKRCENTAIIHFYLKWIKSKAMNDGSQSRVFHFQFFRHSFINKLTANYSWFYILFRSSRNSTSAHYYRNNILNDMYIKLNSTPLSALCPHCGFGVTCQSFPFRTALNFSKQNFSLVLYVSYSTLVRTWLFPTMQA